MEVDILHAPDGLALEPGAVEVLDVRVRLVQHVENLSFQADLAEAVRLVGLDEWLRSLAHGLQTAVGAEGVSLSSEQLVRLAVARAIVTKPPVLTIDDTFSTIQPAVEMELLQAIQAALPALRAGAGSIVWNGVDAGGRPVASGVYFFHVVTPEGDERVGKFTILIAT